MSKQTAVKEEELHKLWLEAKSPDELKLYNLGQKSKLLDDHIAQLLMLIEQDSIMFLINSNSFTYLKKHLTNKL
jgi:hypothetical protein